MNNKHEDKNAILLFDGECHLCNRLIDFMLTYEKKELFKFGSLQSTAGRKIVKEFEIPVTVDSIIVIINGKAYVYSEAVLQTLKVLPWYFRWLRVFRYAPLKWRDVIYIRFAKNRYKLFGKRKTCRIPTEQERSRFLE